MFQLVEWLDQIEKEFERLGDLPLDGQELVSLSEEFAVSCFLFHLCCYFIRTHSLFHPHSWL